MELPEKSLEVLHIAEPSLEFGHGQVCDHPKDGLFLYGPHEGPAMTRPISIRIIGTEKGIALFPTWAATAPAGTTVVGVRITDTRGEVKLFRDGDYPALRGTAM